MSETPKVHVFEAAGLGKAPFRIVGVTERRGPVLLADGITSIGAPGQPMGSCKFCGTGIAECWEIQSADGRRFEVGCDCVRKTGDAGMRKVVEEHVRAKRREQAERRRIAQFEKVRARVEAARALLPSASEALQAVPHPDAYYAQQGKSRLDWVRYLLENAGTAGREVACGWIERAARGEL